MPTINRTKRKAPRIRKDDAFKISQRIYHHPRWRKMRETYLMDHPLCQQCLKSDKVTPATDVHHIRPFLTGNNDMERYALAFDVNNLMSLCEQCHHDLHRSMRDKS